jgi:hypothetical protein
MDHLCIELVYEPSCPNVEQARDAIRRALAVLGAPVAWREWVRNDSATPAALRELAPPSVLVDGQDVGCGDGSIAATTANACRIYADDCGCIVGAPPVELILRTAARQRS